MSALDLAKTYLEIYFSGHSFEKLRDLFGDEFKFQGPLFSFDTPCDYIQSLIDDPPVNCQYKVLYEFEADDNACIVFTFMKSPISCPMALVVSSDSGSIRSMKLVYDTGNFK